jgi:transposase
MWHVGIDLGRKTLYIAAVHDNGSVRDPVSIRCSDSDKILQTFKELKPFRAVIEATGTYRWLFRLLRPYGTVILAHTTRLRALVNRRSKTDKLDSQLLANLLRINQIPLAYIPDDEYQYLRDITRHRARLSRLMTEAKNGLQSILGRNNIIAQYRKPYGPKGLKWFAQQDFTSADNTVRDELLARIAHYKLQLASVDDRLKILKDAFPQVEALLDIHGIGLYFGLLIVAEIGDPERFRSAKQVGAYAGLTARVNQSGNHSYYGHITRQGSSWMRCAFVQIAIRAVRGDAALGNFYVRIRKRSSAKIARVAVARKLAEICWKRLRCWHRMHQESAAV